MTVAAGFLPSSPERESCHFDGFDAAARDSERLMRAGDAPSKNEETAWKGVAVYHTSRSAPKTTSLCFR